MKISHIENGRREDIAIESILKFFLTDSPLYHYTLERRFLGLQFLGITI